MKPLRSGGGSVNRDLCAANVTEQSFRLATRLAPRCADIGIEMALVKRRGEIVDVKP